MAKVTYPEKIGEYIHALGWSTKSELLRKMVLIVFRENTAEEPARLTAFEDLRQLLSDFHPDLHVPYNREELTTSLGQYITEWFGEGLGRPLTGRDLDQLYERLPDSGVRETLKKLATTKEADQ